jgi:hypothetical protein
MLIPLCREKQKYLDVTDDDDDYDTENERSAAKKKVKVSGEPPSEKRSIVICQDALDADEWTKNVGPHEVTCNGCNKKIKLDKKKYATRPWNWHKVKCPAIIGEKLIRSAKPKYDVAGVSLTILSAKTNFDASY